MRVRAAITAAALAITAALAACTPASPSSPRAPAKSATVHPGPHDDGPHPPLLPPRKARPRQHTARGTVSVTVTAAGSYTIDGLDLHDSSLLHAGGTYYLYGSMYGCGYAWYVQDTPWCGFGVSTASSLAGPWTAPRVLFSPSSIDPWSGLTWMAECGSTGQGCFNPRVIVRSGWGYDDDVPILWFNSPIDYSRNHANAYNTMGCASLTGPCGPGATPNGSYNKPSLSICAGNGDFGIIQSGTGGRPAIVCTMPGAASLSIEELNYSGSGGDGTGVRSVAGVSSIEGPGGYWDPGSSQYVLTYSDPGCGYCSGTPTGYATAPALYGTWTAPSNVGFGQPANGRRAISANSCGGQPRTVTVLDGQPYQIIDLWTGSRNETPADTVIAPLTYTPPPVGVAGDGHPWTPPLAETC